MTASLVSPLTLIMPFGSVIIWIALAFWPARVARRKGCSCFGYFALSPIFFPLG